MTTYKPLTPGEAAAAVVNGQRVEGHIVVRADDGCPQWFTFNRYDTTLSCFNDKTEYRLVIEPKPETVEEALGAVLSLSSPIIPEKWKEAWLRVFAALKHEIKTEMREEMKP